MTYVVLCTITLLIAAFVLWTQTKRERIFDSWILFAVLTFVGFCITAFMREPSLYSDTYYECRDLGASLPAWVDDLEFQEMPDSLQKAVVSFYDFTPLIARMGEITHFALPLQGDQKGIATNIGYMGNPIFVRTDKNIVLICVEDTYYVK